MLKATMLTGISTWVAAVKAKIAKLKGNNGNMLFVDNSVGNFSFLSEANVKVFAIAVTDDQVTAVRQKIVNNSASVGTVLINQVSMAIETYNPTAGTWTSDSSIYWNYVKIGRMYYSNADQTLWVTSQYGALNRVVTNGYTKIG